MLRLVQHPNVIRLYEVYESDQYVHMVFEQLSDTQLFHIIRSKPNYTEADAARIMKSLLGVVDFLHSQQVIHRDIRPENIMLGYTLFRARWSRVTGKQFSLKLVNFSLATRATGQVETFCCGTPGYVAPEVINKEGYTMKADIFSCGVIMYMM